MQTSLFINRTLTATEFAINSTHAHFQQNGRNYREIALTFFAVTAELCNDIQALFGLVLAYLDQIVEDATIPEIKVEEVTESVKAAIARVVRQDICDWVSILVAGAVGAIAHQAEVQVCNNTMIVWDAQL